VRSAVLVTGAAGFFGLAIVRALARAGPAVIATDRVPADAFRPRAGTPSEAVEYVCRDIASEPLDDLVARAGTVVHAAAVTPGNESAGTTGDDLLSVNLAPLPGLLRAARTSASCRRVVLVSSAGVYAQQREAVLREEDADGGTSLYGAAKLAAELVAGRYASLYGIEFVAVRPTSLFGAGEVVRPSRPRVTALARLVGHALAREPVRIEGVDARADWLAVDDAAAAVALVCGAPALEEPAYNVSSARPRRFDEVVAAVTAAVGLVVDPSSDLVVDGGPDRPAVISNDRLARDLGWSPVHTLEDGAGELAAFLRGLEPAGTAP
jgi:nucleoside-diphosphate-sugar epimerase